jgi:hypothetical protein
MLLKSVNRREIMVRGCNLNEGTAKIYGEYYLGTISSCKKVNGETALALSLLDETKIVDIDSDTVL